MLLALAAFRMAAAPEGHEPLRTLEELRGHMHGVHGLDIAHMLPQRVLLSLHDKEHAEPEWHGSPDSSRLPGFTGRRVSGVAREDWNRMEQSMRDAGFPGSWMRTETGHHVSVHHSPSPPADLAGGGKPGFRGDAYHEDGHPAHLVDAYLGDDPDQVGPRMIRMLRRPDVLGHMRSQMEWAQHEGFADPRGHGLSVDVTEGR